MEGKLGLFHLDINADDKTKKNKTQDSIEETWRSL